MHAACVVFDVQFRGLEPILLGETDEFETPYRHFSHLRHFTSPVDSY